MATKLVRVLRLESVAEKGSDFPSSQLGLVQSESTPLQTRGGGSLDSYYKKAGLKGLFVEGLCILCLDFVLFWKGRTLTFGRRPNHKTNLLKTISRRTDLRHSGETEIQLYWRYWSGPGWILSIGPNLALGGSFVSDTEVHGTCPQMLSVFSALLLLRHLVLTPLRLEKLEPSHSVLLEFLAMEFTPSITVHMTSKGEFPK
ncbi:uncharacterized protein LOC120374286 isoform X1 [Mauremys reevesii]|uniref:uncharacterized protein LOC120374286 isoform X1 n=1 Tax=Mauremys reevesii TaxID=260615 RepID=UPI00193FEBF4|nr:uncharacterized protein LOC120374286 isoform X1 [Mauremys reevesii]